MIGDYLVINFVMLIQCYFSASILHYVILVSELGGKFADVSDTLRDVVFLEFFVNLTEMLLNDSL